MSSPAPFSAISDTRQKAHNVDAQVLSKWVRKLDELVLACESIQSPPISPTDGMGDGPSAIEVEMLEQERDLIAADLAALKEEVIVVSSNSRPSLCQRMLILCRCNSWSSKNQR